MQFLYPLQDMRAPLSQRDELAHELAGAEELTHLFKSPAETLCGSKVLKAQ